MNVQLIVAAGNRSGQVISVSTEKFIIGRAVDCHLRPTSELVSRYHCAILVGDEVSVRDLGSRNGVRLNGEKITAEKILQNGDKLVIGPLEFYVCITEDGAIPTESPLDASDANWFHQADNEGTDSEALAPTILQHHSDLTDQEKR